MKLIRLVNGKGYTKVSDRWLDCLTQIGPWYGVSKRKGGAIYARNAVGDYMHDIIKPPSSLGLYTDHANRDTLDNQEENLRYATYTQNNSNRNKLANNTSGYIGVCWDKARSVWLAYVSINDTFVHLGRYTVKEVAALAHDIAVFRLHGKFAVLNDPPGITLALVQTTCKKVNAILDKFLNCVGDTEAPPPSSNQTDSLHGDSARVTFSPEVKGVEIEKMEGEFNDLL